MNKQLDNFVEELDKRLAPSPTVRAVIRYELRDHIDERLAELEEQGLSAAEAVEAMIDELGAADEMAAAFEKVPYRRNWIMRTAITTTAIAAAVLLASFLFPQYPGMSVSGSWAQIQSTTHSSLGAVAGSAALRHSALTSSAGLPYMIQMGATGIPAELNHQGIVSVKGIRYSGAGYFRFALVNEGGSAVWMNAPDLSPNDGVPDSSVTLSVNNGYYTVSLGDDSLSGMAPLTPGLFENGSLKLRVWFEDGTQGLQQLAPDQALTSSPYAFMAANVIDEAIDASKLANDSRGLTKITGGNVTIDPQGRLNAIGLRLSDNAEQQLSNLNETHTFGDTWTNIEGLGTPYIVIHSKTRIGDLWILTGRWYWGNDDRIDNLSANTSGILCHSIPNWPYGTVLSIHLQDSMFAHPGSYFNYGGQLDTSPNFSALSRITVPDNTSGLNANLSVPFTLLTLAP